jgi:uncharacterized protein YmfQ (DUF2313 family)
MSNRYSGLTAADFLAATKKLLPPGRAFAVWSGSVKEKLWSAVANTFEQIHGDIVALVDIELDPRITQNLLTRWEECWGLPDSCVEDPGDEEKRRQSLVTKISDPGGLNPSRYIALAKSLGLAVTIDEMRPFTCQSRCEDYVHSDVSRFTWRMFVPESVDVTIATCVDECTVELRSWGDAILECAIELRNRPSCSVYFIYTGGENGTN